MATADPPDDGSAPAQGPPQAGVKAQTPSNWSGAKLRLNTLRGLWCDPICARGGSTLALLVAVVVGGFFFLQLFNADASECFEKSVELEIEASADTLPSSCTGTKPFEAVQENVDYQRERLGDPDDDFEPIEPSAAEGKTALLIWLALFGATAGAAGFTLVKSLCLLCTINPKASQVWIGLLLAGLGLGAVFILLSGLSIDLSEFDDMHKAQITWMPLAVAVLMSSAIVALVALGMKLRSGDQVDLRRVDQLGTTMRQLVAMLGTTLALTVLATAGRYQAIATLPGGVDVPSTAAIGYGAVYALLIALYYVPTHQRWLALANDLIDKEVDRQCQPEVNGKLGTRGYRAEELKTRANLQQVVGTAGAWATLRSSIAVLSPVIAAAISSLFV